ncbi:MAG: T9SS type A sorting domain-containing protein, partial [Bacteroidales bacterium]|nr:T9SS type A sorting domain-containing protein [Bacteroidales bacterium]
LYAFDNYIKMNIIDAKTKSVYPQFSYMIQGVNENTNPPLYYAADYAFYPNIDIMSYKNIDSIYHFYYVRCSSLSFEGWVEICNFSAVTGDTNFVYRIDLDSSIWKGDLTGITATNDGGVIIAANWEKSYLIKFMSNGFVSLASIDKNNVVALAYPNPAKDNINFSCSDVIEELEIFNLLGQKVYASKVKDKFVAVDVSNFVSGNYVAKIHTDKGVITKKIMVE